MDKAPDGWFGPDWDTLSHSEKMSAPRKMAFIHALKENGVIQTGCDAAGVSRTVVMKQWMVLPWFKEAFEDARQIAYDRIEAEAIRRATRGVDEPVVYQGQPTWIPNPHDPDGPPVMFTTKKYSDSLMQTVLKAKRPDEFGDKSKVTVDGPAIPVLVVPSTLQEDDWEKAAAAQQAQYRGNQGEDSNE